MIEEERIREEIYRRERGSAWKGSDKDAGGKEKEAIKTQKESKNDGKG